MFLWMVISLTRSSNKGMNSMESICICSVIPPTITTLRWLVSPMSRPSSTSLRQLFPLWLFWSYSFLQFLVCLQLCVLFWLMFVFLVGFRLSIWIWMLSHPLVSFSLVYVSVLFLYSSVVGIAIDFSSHMTHSFVEKHGTSFQRARSSIEEMGRSLITSGLTTFLGVFMLAFAPVPTNQAFFTMLYIHFFLVGNV